MKKLLEVYQYGDEIRFSTDIDVIQNPDVIADIQAKATFSMATRLWGGKEASVIAIIRALAIADLTLCVNRKEMIEMLDDLSRMGASALNGIRKELSAKMNIVYPAKSKKESVPSMLLIISLPLNMH